MRKKFNRTFYLKCALVLVLLCLYLSPKTRIHSFMLFIAFFYVHFLQAMDCLPFFKKKSK